MAPLRLLSGVSKNVTSGQVRSRTIEQKDGCVAETEKQQRAQLQFDCELLYDRLYPKLRDRFPRKRLADYFEAYMSTGQPFSEVERRARRLQQMLQDTASPPKRSVSSFASLAEIRRHFDLERTKVREAGMRGEVEETYLARIAREEDRAIQEFSDS